MNSGSCNGARYSRTMSEENVEIVRSAYAEWERGNFATPQFFDPSIQMTWVDPIFVPRAETQGIEELNRAMQEFLDAWENVTVTAERIVDAGDQVVTVNVWRARGRASGARVEVRQGSVWTLSNGRVTRMVNYGDPAKAFAAAGLSQ